MSLMQRKYTGEEEKAKLIPRIASYETMEDSDGKYVVYKIEISTFLGKIKIQKRYKELQQLYQHVLNKHPENCKEIPSFPEKLWFSSNFAPEKINVRMEMFQAILNFIFSNIKIDQDAYIQEFFHIDSHTVILLQSVKVKSEEDTPISSGNFLFENNNLKFEDVEEFLKLINFDSNNISVYAKMYEAASKKCLQPLPDDLIRKLLFGTPKYKGLLTLCGKDNRTSSISCLNLLSTLLNYEIYQFAESIQKIFATSKIDQIKEMHLERDIKMPNTKNSPGLVLLYFYTSMNEIFGSDIEKILNDSKAFEVYSKWFEQKVDKGYLFSKSKIFQTIITTHDFSSENLKNEDLPFIISKRSETIVLDPVEILRSKENIKEFTDKVFSLNLNLNLNKDKNYWKVDSLLSQQGLIVQENASKELFRLTATLDDFDMIEIYSILTTYDKYSKYLPKFLGGITLRPFENGEDICHLVFRNELKMKELILLRQISTKSPSEELKMMIATINVNDSTIKNSNIKKSYLNTVILDCTQIKSDKEGKKVELDLFCDISSSKNDLTNISDKKAYLDYCLLTLKRIKMGSSVNINKSLI